MSDNAKPGKKSFKVKAHGASMGNVPPAQEHSEQNTPTVPEGTVMVFLPPAMARQIVALAAKYGTSEDPDIQLLVGPLVVIADVVKAAQQ